MLKKTVLAVTGIRSEYDILYPVLEELRESGEFEVNIVVSGAHLSDWHGYTIDRIRNDNFEIVDSIDSLFMTNRTTQRVKGIGSLLVGLSQTVERIAPHFLLVIGDREEAIATALVGNYMDILVAHIGGGDAVFGNADDPIRHAVSRLSHIHFVFTEKNKELLLKHGEEEFRVYNVGNPSLDNIRKTKTITRAEISLYLANDVQNYDYFIFIYNPLSSEKDKAYEQTKLVLQTLQMIGTENKLKTIAIYPNTDPGFYDILRAIKEFENSDYISFYKTLPREIFINLLRNARAIVGNSSTGILEAPFYQLPVVNVGNRQKGRMAAENVKFVNFDEELIKNEILEACYNEEYRKSIERVANFYGDGYASKKIAERLSLIDLSDKNYFIKKIIKR